VQEIINLFRLEGAEVQLSAVRVRERERRASNTVRAMPANWLGFLLPVVNRAGS